MIRPATADDIEELLELAYEFYSMTALAFEPAFDRASTEATIRQLLANPDAHILVIERGGRVVGVTAAVISPLMFNARARMAHEILWFVTAPHRGGRDALRLFDALEAWAKSKGVAFMLMAALACNPDVAKIYQRRGYVQQETSFLKRL